MSSLSHEDLRAVGEFFVELGRRGIALRACGVTSGDLLFRPRKLDPDLVARLRLHKLRILAVLCSVESELETGTNADWVYVAEERLGIALDSGDEVHHGSPPWLTAIGEALIYRSKSLESPPAPVTVSACNKTERKSGLRKVG